MSYNCNTMSCLTMFWKYALFECPNKLVKLERSIERKCELHLMMVCLVLNNSTFIHFNIFVFNSFVLVITVYYRHYATHTECSSEVKLNMRRKCLHGQVLVSMNSPVKCYSTEYCVQWFHSLS